MNRAESKEVFPHRRPRWVLDGYSRGILLLGCACHARPRPCARILRTKALSCAVGDRGCPQAPNWSAALGSDGREDGVRSTISDRRMLCRVGTPMGGGTLFFSSLFPRIPLRTPHFLLRSFCSAPSAPALLPHSFLTLSLYLPLRGAVIRFSLFLGPSWSRTFSHLHLRFINAGISEHFSPLISRLFTNSGRPSPASSLFSHFPHWPFSLRYRSSLSSPCTSLPSAGLTRLTSRPRKTAILRTRRQWVQLWYTEQ